MLLDDIALLLQPTDYSGFRCEPVARGFSTTVFKLTRGQQTYYLRILASGERASTQALAHQQMSSLGVSLPQVTLFEDFSPQLHGLSYMIVSEVKGAPLQDSPHLTDNQLKNILFHAGVDLAKLNSLPVSGVGEITFISHGRLCAPGKSYHDYLYRVFSINLQKLVENKVISKSRADNMTDFVLHHLHLCQINGSSSLSHDDFDLSHIYQFQGIYSGIIDFGNISGTTPFHDLAYFMISTSYFSYLVKGYETFSPLPPDIGAKLKVEALLIAADRLYRIMSKHPEYLTGNPILSYLNREV